MDKSTFGEHLRREREMRGVSLEEISAATRIGTRFLEALEGEQWERLPGGVFNRGFVRAIARFLGLDEEGLVGEYALATSDRPVTRAWAEKPPAAGAGTRWLPWLLILFAVALAAGTWFAWHRYAFWRAGRHPVAVSTARPAAHIPAAPQAAAATDQPALAPASSAGPTAGETQTLQLKIEAGKTTAVRVTADGKSLFEGKITAGRSQRFQAREQFEVWARNAGALQLELNGQTLAPLGPPGKPARVTLNRKNLKKPPGGPD